MRKKGKEGSDKEKLFFCIRIEFKFYFEFLKVFICSCFKGLCYFGFFGIVFLEFFVIRYGDILGLLFLELGRKRFSEGWYIFIIYRNKIFIFRFIFMRIWIFFNILKEIWNGSYVWVEV